MRESLKQKVVDIYRHKEYNWDETVNEIVRIIKDELALSLEPYFTGWWKSLVNACFTRFSKVSEILQEFEWLKFQNFFFFRRNSNLLKWVENVLDIGSWNGIFSINALYRYKPKKIKTIELIDFSETILVPNIFIILQEYLSNSEIFKIYKEKGLDTIDGFYNTEDFEKILSVLRKYRDSFKFHFKNLEEFYDDKLKTEILCSDKVNKTILFAIRVINNLRFKENITWLPIEIKKEFLDKFVKLASQVFIYDVKVWWNFPKAILSSLRFSKFDLEIDYNVKLEKNNNRKEIYLYIFRE